MSMTDKKLKAVIKLLREMAARGTTEPGQMETFTRAIGDLRKASRSHNPVKMQAAVGRVAQLFLRQYDR